MKVTYKIGPSGNNYCEIKTRDYKFNYGIDGIRKGKRFKHKQRRELILHTIAQNSIRHTHLIKIANDLGKLAKKTTEKVLLDLEKDRLIEFEQDNSSPNSVKIWKIKRPEFKFEKIAKKESKNIISSLEYYVKFVEKNFNHWNGIKKDQAMTCLLGIAHSWEPIIRIIDQETKIKNEKKKFDSLVTRAYDIFKHEKKGVVDGRPLLRRLLHLKSSNVFFEMDEFINELDGKKKPRIVPPVHFI